MIIDTEVIPKSPTSPSADSPQTWAPASLPVSSEHVQYHRSYSTFAEAASFSSSRAYDQGRMDAAASDVSRLLARNFPQSLSDDDQPPAYHDIETSSTSARSRGRFWTRCAAVLITVFLAYSTWFSYELSKHAKSNPNSPSDDTPSTTIPPKSTGSPSLPPPRSPPAPSNPPLPPPAQPSLPPLPPYDHIPNPHDVPFMFPISGRTDLCRTWAYALDSGAQPSGFENRPTDRLMYTIPTLAPFHIETSSICPLENGTNGVCKDDSTKDVVSGKLQVVSADIQLPSVELFLQHGSEAGLEDVSVCLMKKPIAQGDQFSGYRWVLGIHLWKDPAASGTKNPLASVSIVVSLPQSRPHDFSTHLDHFFQSIGSAAADLEYPLLFGKLSLEGLFRDITVANVTADVIEVSSRIGNVDVDTTRVSGSLSLRSQLGLVASNTTLVHNPNQPPVKVDVQAAIGMAVAIVSLEYSTHPHSTPPQFDLNVHSRFSRADAWIIDRQGSDSLATNPSLPTILPIINLNLTSSFAIAQALIPGTYHGSIDLRSSHASIVMDDHAREVPGRRLEWEEREAGVKKGMVQWNGKDQEAKGGSVSVSTGYASVRLLMLGLEGTDIGVWPDSADNLILGWW